jgi:hypothetical protein
MWKIERTAAMALVAALCSCPGAAQEGRGTLTKRLTGDAVLAIDAKGRLVVGVDLAADARQAWPGRGTDGQVDEVFLLFGMRPDAAVPFLRRGPRPVTIEVGERDVLVQFRDEAARLRLTTQPTASGRRAGAEEETVLTGIELVRRTWMPARLSGVFEGDRNMSFFSTDAFPSVADEIHRGEDPAGPLGDGDANRRQPTREARPAASRPSIQKCDGGDPNAPSCSVRCNALLGHLTWGCSVTCSSGYYACCNCDGGCKCVAKFDSLWPASFDP